VARDKGKDVKADGVVGTRSPSHVADEAASVPPHQMEPRSALRIALFSGNYNYVRDGANQALNRLVDHLETSVGAAVRVYSPTSPTPAFAPNGTLVSVPSIAIPGRGEYRLALGLPKSIRADIAAFAPNVVHLSAPDWLGSAAKRFAHEHSIPVVTSLHTRFETYLSYYGMRWARARMERYLARFYGTSDLVLVPTPPLLDEFRARGFADRVALWGRGVDPRAFHPSFRSLAWRRQHGIADDERVVLFFGRLVKEKGVSDFAAMLAVARTKGAVIRPLLVGEGPARAWVAAELPGAVFTGHLSGMDLGRAVASADIFVNPSLTEAFGNVTLEAMASGLATICADVPSGRALIAQGETGLLCSNMTASGYADVLCALVANPTLRHQLSTNAFAASQDYTWSETLDAVVAAYRKVTRLR
jgi:phosphatidylinositol alpha 1,6-mannosyltransferase